MMITEQDIIARAQQLVMRGIPRDAAVSEAKIELQHERAQLEQAARVKVEAANPPQQPREWAQKLDIIEAIDAQNDAIRNDPQIIAQKAARQQQIEAQAARLREQRNAIDRQLADLDAEWRANL